MSDGISDMNIKQVERCEKKEVKMVIKVKEKPEDIKEIDKIVVGIYDIDGDFEKAVLLDIEDRLHLPNDPCFSEIVENYIEHEHKNKRYYWHEIDEIVKIKPEDD